MTLDEIMAEFGLLRRPAMDFLDLLVSVDLLARDGDGADALLSRSVAAAHPPAFR